MGQVTSEGNGDISPSPNLSQQGRGTETSTKPENFHWLKRFVIGKSPKRTLIRTIIVSVLAFLVFKTLFLPVRVDGASMKPLYSTGDFTLINTLSYKFSQPERGDIIAISTTGQSIMYLKRIIGLPGDTVEFKEGLLILNGTPFKEEYNKLGSSWNMEPVTVEDGEYFVVGDNRSMQMKNHVFGSIHETKIVGRPLF